MEIKEFARKKILWTCTTCGHNGYVESNPYLGFDPDAVGTVICPKCNSNMKKGE